MKDEAGILAEVVEIVVALEEGVRKLSSALASSHRIARAEVQPAPRLLQGLIEQADMTNRAAPAGYRSRQIGSAPRAWGMACSQENNLAGVHRRRLGLLGHRQIGFKERFLAATKAFPPIASPPERTGKRSRHTPARTCGGEVGAEGQGVIPARHSRLVVPEVLALAVERLSA
jgi:hypothetical protein